MHKRITVHVGLDVHRDSIEIALADGTSGGEVRHHGHTAIRNGVTLSPFQHQEFCA
jgi:hypothetical protein